MTQTHCPYCALQCGMTVTPGTNDTDGPTVGERDFPTNRGGMCQKGWTSAALLGGDGRLTTPLARDSRAEPLRPTTWEDALDRTAAAIRRTQRAHGRDAVGVFGGGGLTNEKAYLLGKFARVALRTSAIDYNGRFCMSSAAAAGNRAFGVDRGLPFPLPDLADADCILLVGSNPAETMPPFTRWLADQRARGGALVVVDPRLTPTAQRATLHLQLTPGTDLALANGLLHRVIAGGHVDVDYVRARTTGFDEVARVVASYWPERVERITGVSVADQQAAVDLLVRAERAMVLTARGAEQHSKGVDTVSALIDLALALGLPGRPGRGYGCLTGQGNGQGGREHGQKADQLPGYRRLDDPAAREHVAGVWGVAADDLPGPGRSAYELLAGLGDADGVRALLVAGSNVVVSVPSSGRIRDRLGRLDFLAVSDVVLSETAALADVVLPVAQWAEEDGTMTNLEGRVLLRRQALRPPPGVRTDLDVVAGLATRLGAPGEWPTLPRVVFDELRRASAGGPADYAGISYERIAAEDGVFWPCPDDGHPGTPRMFLDRFATPDGRARFVPVEHRPAAEDVDADYPVYLTTGRVLRHYQSGAQTRRIAALRDAHPEAAVEIHPDLAEQHDLGEGNRVRVVSRRGAAEGPVRITDTIRTDTVFMPFHWGGANSVNAVTNAALDPISRMPEFKVCAVRLERCP
ncbi:assimilatory nitrate reductase (NADH) alpha subunit apoprotein [Jatrophihabitans endophyticus]|uniref:Assimilatory nitrate reductase (NADH) alpha subunit apoprotein n=1 Tax=Jatrophihabitans endophyticus TaxID=1206085 RepID=A0A1M5T0X3_9ACTN|nr:molybdopterin oxidoreductase family protein [Jatrophihabitans endophyticus]SHH44454.1 assimilatory nitrate reductase (NADH) alpha subunit apoprotein [Jatrophihabitans endophyticus]